MGETHKGNSPKNARIKIKYTDGQKPAVSFSYPNKKRQVGGSTIDLLFIVWGIVLIIGYYGFALGAQLGEPYTPTELEKFTVCATEKWDSVDGNYSAVREVCEEDNLASPRVATYRLLRQILLIFLVMFMPPFAVQRIFKKPLSNVFPKWEAFKARKKIRKFAPEEVEFDEKHGWYCEIPVFNNVILNFDATGEFSKYLEEFEIREHSFRVYKTRRGRGKGEKKKGKYVPPKTFNEFIWYARFYFKEQPKTGKLEVLFK